MANALRRYWPVDVLALIFLIVVFLFGSYLTSRQHAADSHAEKQRQAICAILANIPGHIPPEIARARTVFARPGHPRDCQPLARRKARSTPTPTVTPEPRQTVVVVVTPAPRSSPAPTATPTRTPHPRPTHTPTPHPTPTRTPCLLPGVPPGCG